MSRHMLIICRALLFFQLINIVDFYLSMTHLMCIPRSFFITWLIHHLLKFHNFKYLQLCNLILHICLSLQLNICRDFHNQHILITSYPLMISLFVEWYYLLLYLLQNTIHVLIKITKNLSFKRCRLIMKYKQYSKHAYL